MIHCDCCGTYDNVTYHPKLGYGLCRQCEKAYMLILGILEDSGGQATPKKIMKGVEMWLKVKREA